MAELPRAGQRLRGNWWIFPVLLVVQECLERALSITSSEDKQRQKTTRFKHCPNSSQAAMTVSGLGEASQMILLVLHSTVVILKEHLCSPPASQRSSFCRSIPAGASTANSLSAAREKLPRVPTPALLALLLTPFLSLAAQEQISIVPD
ncbi:hypothetical protein AV530_011080 [Patagioenas fasciata monilis]|uniref:Uncharacterized protein n=1 Tax=Patagioenas fasciata monilis TaxID=372326 RepID=A0A1V4JVX0_PATFA|nr:hypothetical protein AV530_011080 [Patagioenas fasciata monilis]